MRRFWCSCGQPLFFDSTNCTSCGLKVGYDPIQDDMVTLSGVGQIDFLAGSQGGFNYCRNGLEHNACNWVVPAENSGSLCLGCSFNRTIPNLNIPQNITRWRRFEAAKKRLLYTCYHLDLPISSGWYDKERGLLFDFLEDQRTNPILLESFVSTGYLSGVITINALEADDASREATRQRMNESYRTLLGHLRHESGHYFYGYLNDDASFRQEFSELFGDASIDYQEALDLHYKNGPVEGWRESYISGYASSHPFEDWAECWSHFLHMTDTLETALAYGMVNENAFEGDFSRTASKWRRFSVALNELNRSMGLRDAYPFVITPEVEKKLDFVGRVVSWLRQSPERAATG